VRENVIIAYRGANYEIGQWPHGYGIWAGSSPQPHPMEWWPPTPEGWSAAWYRFVAIETPGTIVAATPPAGPAGPVGAVTASPSGSQPMAMSSSQPTAVLTDQATAAAAGQASAAGQAGWVAADGGRSGRTAAILLAIGIVVGLIGLFPNYQGSGSLASEAFNLVPHLFYLAAWAVGAVLIVRGGTGQRTGVLLATGVSVVTFGLMFSDAGFAMADGAHLIKAGLVLTLVSWVLCAAGSLLAFARMPKAWPRRPLGREAAVALTLIGAAIGAAITFAPSWDSYLLTNSSGQSETITLGNAFSNPGWVIAGNVAVMAALVAVVAVAAFWRPARLGWALAAGAIIPLVGQALSGIIEINSQTAAAQLGISASQASQAGLTVDSSLTAAYWFFCVFLIVLALGCAWLGTSGDLAWSRPAGPASPWATPPSAYAAAAGPVAPASGSPTFGSPSLGTPTFGTPSYGTPSYGTPAPDSPAAAGPAPTAGPQDVSDAGAGLNGTGINGTDLNGTDLNSTASTDEA
jgi:hypothetical protein